MVPVIGTDDNYGLLNAATRYAFAVLYGCVLVYSYEILSGWWSYFGFSYLLQEPVVAYGLTLIAAIPAVLLPGRCDTMAKVASWLLYILVFLPCMLVPIMQQSHGMAHSLRLFSIVLGSAILFILISRGEVKFVRPPVIPESILWMFIAFAWVAMMGITLVGFGGHFRIVGVEDVYDQRFAAASAAANPVVRYSMLFCGNALNPFLLAYGLSRKRWIPAALGTAGQVVLFGTVAFRAVLISPLLIAGVYFLFNRSKLMSTPRLMAGVFAVAILPLPLMADYDPQAGLTGNLLSLIYLRTLLISGTTFGVYDDFFSISPVTYFSHLNIVSLFVPYPYPGFSIGQVVGLFLAPSNSADLLELNANFVATDGVAAIGVAGIPFMCITLGLILRFMSKFISPEKLPAACAALVTFFIGLSNVSMFTSLLTQGGAIVTALFFLLPEATAPAEAPKPDEESGVGARTS